MICASCHEETQTEPICEVCGDPCLLEDRYAFISYLGKGATASLYRARDLLENQDVAIKEQLCARPGSEESRLAVRETRLLQELKHPQIPNEMFQTYAKSTSNVPRNTATHGLKVFQTCSKEVPKASQNCYTATHV